MGRKKVIEKATEVDQEELYNLVIDSDIARPVNNLIPDYKRLAIDIIKGYFFEMGRDIMDNTTKIPQEFYCGAFSEVGSTLFRVTAADLSSRSLLMDRPDLWGIVIECFLDICQKFCIVPNVYKLALFTNTDKQTINNLRNEEYNILDNNNNIYIYNGVKYKASAYMISQLKKLVDFGGSMLQEKAISGGGVGLVAVLNNSTDYNEQWATQRAVTGATVQKAVQVADTMQDFKAFLSDKQN